MTTAFAPNQRWTPAAGKRAKAREIMRLQTDPDGYPGVVWTQFWPNCGHTDISIMRESSFRAWIRKMCATMAEVTNEF